MKIQHQTLGVKRIKNIHDHERNNEKGKHDLLKSVPLIDNEFAHYILFLNDDTCGTHQLDRI